MTDTATQGVDFEAIKQVQRQIWGAGDFARVATLTTIVGEELCEALDIVPDESVLDVACGSGNGALAAARRTGGKVVGVDYVPELLEHGRLRAETERLPVEWVEGDAEKLPVEDGSFDVVLSIYGSMFAPDQERAAAELLRACRPGGRIGMANWTPTGAVGQVQGILTKHAPPPPGVKPPFTWGTEEGLRELFGDGISDLEITKRNFNFRFRSVDHWLEFFRDNFGPVKMTFERLDDEGREALEAEGREALERFNRSDRAFVAPAEYLEVVATRA